LHRLEENVAAVNIDLSEDERAALRRAASEIKIVGGRYPESLERMTGL
jgi:aryl-alcohol dehydrogenase-like predicted oxidoreductase